MTATYEESQIRLLAYPIDEKWASEQNELVNSSSSSCPARKHCCNNGRRSVWAKASLAGLLATLLMLASFLAMSLLCPEVHSLFKRQSTGTSSGNNQSAFTSHKLWIIIVVVVGMRSLGSTNNRSPYYRNSRYHGFGLVLPRRIQQSIVLSLLHARVLWLLRFSSSIIHANRRLS